MSEASQLYDNYKWRSLATYKNAWDANRVFGCDCYDGYSGYDCSQTACSLGDDPVYTAVMGLTPEVQTVTCSCPGTCSGYFVVKAFGKHTDPIAFNAVAETSDETASSHATGTGAGESLQSKLNSMHSQRIVSSVVYSSGSSICSDAGTVATVTFVTGLGNMQLLELVGYDTLLSDGTSLRNGAAVNLTATTSADGTTVSAECSNRGSCNRATGKCSCQAGFSASDGDSSEVSMRAP